jgi:glycosyltransferase involved in cell wall biosynthesis
VHRIVVLNDHSAVVGGASALAVASAIGLAGKGRAVTYLAGDAGNNPEMQAAGIGVQGLGWRNLLDRGRVSALVHGTYNREAASFVARWIDENDTPETAYHLHNWSQIFSPAIFSALRRVADRVVLSAHDFFYACPNGAFVDYPTGSICELRPLSMACIRRQCDRRSYAEKLWRVGRTAVLSSLDFGNASAVPLLVIHARMREFFERSGVDGDRIEVLPNPVRPYSAQRVRAEENRKVFFIGRLTREKGADLALEAIRAAGLEAVVIGTGPLAEDLAKRFPEAEFRGWCSHAEIGELVGSARMVLLPTQYPEPFGLVAVESVMSGLPVITTDTAFIADALVENGFGAAVSEQTPAAYATALRSLADDATVRRMSEQCHARGGLLATTPEAWLDRLDVVYAERVRKAGSVARQPAAFGAAS